MLRIMYPTTPPTRLRSCSRFRFRSCFCSYPQHHFGLSLHALVRPGQKETDIQLAHIIDTIVSVRATGRFTQTTISSRYFSLFQAK